MADKLRWVNGEGRHKFRKTTKEYQCWLNVKARCKPGYVQAYLYFDRGISMAQEWNDYSTFIRDMGRAPSKKHSIERVNNDGGYNKANCKWALPSEQMRNIRRNRLITIDGVTKCFIDWCNQTGVVYTTAHKRISSGWDERRALFYVPPKDGRTR